jgi:hypothetical protein
MPKGCQYIDGADFHMKGDGSWWENDARGIPLARVCDHCIREKLAGYRPDVLTDSQYEADDIGDDEPL